ncbi:hypothetical protein VPH526E571_0042 [Vibrio phage 526E57-1]
MSKTLSTSSARPMPLSMSLTGCVQGLFCPYAPTCTRI